MPSSASAGRKDLRDRIMCRCVRLTLAAKARAPTGRYAERVDPEPGERVFYHGHPAWGSMLAFYIKGFVAAIVLGALVGIISALTNRTVQTPWIAATVAVSLAGVMLVGFIRRVQTTYTITEKRLTIDRGLLSRDVHETRLVRVQNVNSSQTLLERMLGIGTVDFDTAGSAEYDFAFRGVARPHRIVRTVDLAMQELGHVPPADV